MCANPNNSPPDASAPTEKDHLMMAQLANAERTGEANRLPTIRDSQIPSRILQIFLERDQIPSNKRGHYPDSWTEDMKFVYKNRRLRDARKVYRKRHKDRVKSDNDRWRKSRKGWLNSVRCSARHRGIPMLMSTEELLSFYGKPCAYCATRDNVYIDRIVSKMPGPNGKFVKAPYCIDNVLACCSMCNRMKNSTPLSQWVEHMARIMKNLGHMAGPQIDPVICDRSTDSDNSASDEEKNMAPPKAPEDSQEPQEATEA